jgi:hypothetical protein
MLLVGTREGLQHLIFLARVHLGFRGCHRASF